MWATERDQTASLEPDAATTYDVKGMKHIIIGYKIRTSFNAGSTVEDVIRALAWSLPGKT